MIDEIEKERVDFSKLDEKELEKILDGKDTSITDNRDEESDEEINKKMSRKEKKELKCDKPEKLERTLFIGNLPISICTDKVRKKILITFYLLILRK